MSFEGLLTETISVKRKSDLLREGSAIGEVMTLEFQPPTAAKLLLRIAGATTGSGTLTVVGTVSGVADSEVVTFTSNGVKETTKLYSEVTSITQSGFTNEASVGTLEIRARTAAGQPLYEERLQFERRARVVDLGSPRYRFQKVGAIADVTHKFFLLYASSQEILEKDIIIDGRGNRYEVLPGGGFIEDDEKIHHLELLAKRIQA